MNSVDKANNSGGKFLKWSLVVGIVLVLNLFFNYALSLVYKAPEFNSFYDTRTFALNIETEEECLSVEGLWVPNVHKIDGVTKEGTILGYCDPDFHARNSYEEARVKYNLNVFIILVLLGIGALIFSAFSKKIVLSTSFAWGGILSVVIASIRYWASADNWVRVLILGIALCSLIYVAIKRFDK